MNMTQERLKELFDYNSTTGVFTRKAGRRKVGCVDARGYLKIKIDSKIFAAHRLAWLYVYGSFPKGQIDHENHDRLDNRISNLSDITPVENSRNQSPRKTNTSGHMGVSFDKHKGKWISHIHVCGKRKHIGSFTDISDAITARKDAEVLYGYHTNHGVA